MHSKLPRMNPVPLAQFASDLVVTSMLPFAAEPRLMQDMRRSTWGLSNIPYPGSGLPPHFRETFRELSRASFFRGRPDLKPIQQLEQL